MIRNKLWDGGHVCLAPEYISGFTRSLAVHRRSNYIREREERLFVKSIQTMSLLEPPSVLLRLLHESLPETSTLANDDDDMVGREEIFAYVAFLAKGLAELNEFNADVWRDTLEPYLDQVVSLDKSKKDDMVETFRQAAEKELTDQDDAESYGDGDDDAEEICDLRFNLAYGGKILLHQTRLHLLRGRRYGM